MIDWIRKADTSHQMTQGEAIDAVVEHARESQNPDHPYVQVFILVTVNGEKARLHYRITHSSTPIDHEESIPAEMKL